MTPTGERQMGVTLDEIRSDHVWRYRFAANWVGEGARVLDAGCGCGYGSWLLAKERQADVVGMDASEEAVEYARQTWMYGGEGCGRTEYVTGRIDLSTQLPPAVFGFSVAVCLECIEHVEDPSCALWQMHAATIPGAVLVLSSPNEDVMPFTRAGFPFHRRHWRQGELVELLLAGGWRPRLMVSQWREGGVFEPGTKGMYLVAVCERMED